MPDKIFQSSHRASNRPHTRAQGVPANGRIHTSALRLVPAWRDASGKAPDSLLPGVGSEFHNGDRRG